MQHWRWSQNLILSHTWGGHGQASLAPLATPAHAGGPGQRSYRCNLTKEFLLEHFPTDAFLTPRLRPRRDPYPPPQRPTSFFRSGCDLDFSTTSLSFSTLTVPLATTIDLSVCPPKPGPDRTFSFRSSTYRKDGGQEERRLRGADARERLCRERAIPAQPATTVSSGEPDAAILWQDRPQPGGVHYGILPVIHQHDGGEQIRCLGDVLEPQLLVPCHSGMSPFRRRQTSAGHRSNKCGLVYRMYSHHYDLQATGRDLQARSIRCDKGKEMCVLRVKSCLGQAEIVGLTLSRVPYLAAPRGHDLH